MPSDLDQLLEMGFESERAKIAVAKSGGCESQCLFQDFMSLSISLNIRFIFVSILSYDAN